jgi:hypothetical protein
MRHLFWRSYREKRLVTRLLRSGLLLASERIAGILGRNSACLGVSEPT